MGGRLLGWRPVCAVEVDSYAREVLLARQRDGHLERFPVWDDVRTFDGRPWRGRVGVVTAGWPCQDISCAGKGEGIKGERSGLWVEVARILGEVRPRHFFGENSPMLLHNRGWRTVFGDLSALGFSFRWGVVGAHHLPNAPHKRERVWIAATNTSGRRHKPQEEEVCSRRDSPINGDWWASQPGFQRMDDGVANRVDRLRAIGNGQVSAVAEFAWRTLADG